MGTDCMVYKPGDILFASPTLYSLRDPEDIELVKELTEVGFLIINSYTMYNGEQHYDILRIDNSGGVNYISNHNFKANDFWIWSKNRYSWK